MVKKLIEKDSIVFMTENEVLAPQQTQSLCTLTQLHHRINMTFILS